MEKTVLLQGKIPKLQQLFAKNWLQYGGPGYQSGGKEQQHGSLNLWFIVTCKISVCGAIQRKSTSAFANANILLFITLLQKMRSQNQGNYIWTSSVIFY